MRSLQKLDTPKYVDDQNVTTESARCLRAGSKAALGILKPYCKLLRNLACLCHENCKDTPHKIAGMMGLFAVLVATSCSSSMEKTAWMQPALKSSSWTI